MCFATHGGVFIAKTPVQDLSRSRLCCARFNFSNLFHKCRRDFRDNFWKMYVNSQIFKSTETETQIVTYSVKQTWENWKCAKKCVAFLIDKLFCPAPDIMLEECGGKTNRKCFALSVTQLPLWDCGWRCQDFLWWFEFRENTQRHFDKINK